MGSELNNICTVYVFANLLNKRSSILPNDDHFLRSSFSSFVRKKKEDVLTKAYIR